MCFLGGSFYMFPPFTQSIDSFRKILLLLGQSAIFMLDTLEILAQKRILDFFPELLFSVRDGKRYNFKRKADLCFAKLQIFAYALLYINHSIDESKKQCPEAVKEKNFWREQKSAIISTSFSLGFLRYLQLEKGAISIPLNYYLVLLFSLFN